MEVKHWKSVKLWKRGPGTHEPVLLYTEKAVVLRKIRDTRIFPIIAAELAGDKLVFDGTYSIFGFAVTFAPPDALVHTVARRAVESSGHGLVHGMSLDLFYNDGEGLRRTHDAVERAVCANALRDGAPLPEKFTPFYFGIDWTGIDDSAAKGFTNRARVSRL